MPAHLAALGGAWVLWCTLHSLLAWPPLVVHVRRRLGSGGRYYRLLYNLVAVATLLPVIAIYLRVNGSLLFLWPEWSRPLLWVVRGLALGLMVAGARVYSMADFLGCSGRSAELAGQPGALVIKGVLGVVRHPWYLAGFLLLWSRDLAARDLVTAILLSIYLWVGTLFEERRLLAEYGERFRRYQNTVPRFWPRFRRPR